MVVNDLHTPLRPIFWLSKAFAAYPVKKYSKVYSMVTILISATSAAILFFDKYMSEDEEEVVEVATIAPVDGPPTFSQDPYMARIIWVWMEHLQNLDDTLLCIVLYFGYSSHRNTDIETVLDTIRQGHDRILKLGLTPKYRNWRGIILVLISFFHAYLIYYSIVRIEKTYFSITILKNIAAAVLPRFISHFYISQFFCLMELVQDQVQCLVDGLTRENQWYLESVINIQSHLMNSSNCIFDMFMKFLATCIVHSGIAVLLNAYTVTQQSLNFYAILVVFEMLVLTRIIHACGRMKSKVNEFNFDLFKLMRNSDNLCDNPKLFLFLTTKQTVDFSAGGFFEISYSTIISIGAASMTYLVILVQLSKPK